MKNEEYRKLRRKINGAMNSLEFALNSIKSDIEDAERDGDESRLGRLCDSLLEIKYLTFTFQNRLESDLNVGKMYRDTCEKWYDIVIHRNKGKHKLEDNPHLSDIDTYRSLQNVPT